LTRYLVDTNIISARHQPAILAWMEAATDRLYLSAITIAEIDSGIAKKRREGAVRQTAMLDEWRQLIVHLYGDRILPFDLVVAAIAGRMIDDSRALGLAPGFADIAIAATAEANGLVLLTRNIRHFERLGITLINPFDGLRALD
jgi:predicted nucleic acid-binding protein